MGFFKHYVSPAEQKYKKEKAKKYNAKRAAEIKSDPKAKARHDALRADIRNPSPKMSAKQAKEAAKKEAVEAYKAARQEKYRTDAEFRKRNDEMSAEIRRNREEILARKKR